MVKFAQKHEAKEKIAFFEKGEKVISECSGTKCFIFSCRHGSSYMLDPVKVFFDSTIAKENTRFYGCLKYQNLLCRAQDHFFRLLYLNVIIQ